MDDDKQIFDMTELDAHNNIKEIHLKRRLLKAKNKKYKKEIINKKKGSKKNVQNCFRYRRTI